MLRYSEYFLVLLAYESKKKIHAHTMGQFEETKLKLHLHFIKSQIFKYQFHLPWVGNQAHKSLSLQGTMSEHIKLQM